MQINNPDEICFYHITPIDNLPQIIQNGLWSNKEVAERFPFYTDIGYPHIKNRRLEKSIPFCPSIKVGQCVPFYFTVRSPMLYVITKKNPGVKYLKGGREIIYLVSKLKTICEANVQWFFTDRNAADEFAQFFKAIQDLDKVDWAAIKSNTWGGYNPQKPELKSKKQAEVLVYPVFYWNWFHEIVVHDDIIKQQVKTIQYKFSCPFKPVRVERSWYYD